jgi:NADPH-dependent 2,4-dienoyl-CoA reductase/sulfur reductase-like enzyme/rhodanese-related sulfurtransferase
VTLPIPGKDKAGVYTVFTVPDADAIMAWLARGVQSAVVIGGGFIGLETAENLRARGLNVTLVEKLPQLMSNMDPEFSDVMVREFQALGIDVITGLGVTEVTGGESADGVRLEDGRRLSADLVIMAAGVKGSTELAQKAGCRLGESGGVWVDAGMRTSVPDVFAAGDIVECVNLVTGQKVRNPLAGAANKQGRVAGANAAGGNMRFPGAVGTSVLKVGGLIAARTGLNTREAREAGLDFECLYVPGFSNATYYPDACPLILKLTVEKQTGRLLGAQGIGRKGVDKRIDVLATAIYGHMTVFDLENLDLAYTPPVGSAKDPVVLGGMIAANVVRGEVEACLPQDLPALLADPDAVVLDVRTQEEWDDGHVEGAVLLPVDELRARLGELDKAKRYAVYCGVGYRAYVACLVLKAYGFRAMNVSGGWRAINMSV